MSTVLHRLGAWADSDPNSIAQRYKKEGHWISLTAREFRDRVYWIALYLESQGMTAEDIGTIFSYNCCQWVHLDLAAILLGAKSAGIYPNSTAKDVNYILNHTESRFLSVQNKEYYDKIMGESATYPLPDRIKLILVFEGSTSFSPKAVSYETAVLEGRKLAASKGVKKYSDYLKALDPQAGAFMIYTSGTTGTPKGALVSHDNMTYIVDMVIKNWEVSETEGSLFSFLPLCHIAEKMQNIGAGISKRYTVSFCTSFDNIATEMPEVQPTMLLCVPRLWEKMMEGVQHKLEKAPTARKKLAYWALGVGAKMSEKKYAGEQPSAFETLQWRIAERLVLSKIRNALGLGNAAILASGAAPLASHVCKWFRSLGLEINEAFGQTETAGVICLTPKGVDCAGSVGKPIIGIEVKFEEDGEILTRGRHIFKGYFKDQAATDAVMKDGWLCTGDLAEVGKDGLVRIRGRKKEILKTSGGKMVAPSPIEEALKAAPIISQVCMVGDGRKYLSALITLSESKLNELQNVNGTLKDRVITAPKVVDEIKQVIDHLNQNLASFEQIKKFAILSHEFSIADGEMTPTLKMKRNVIESRYKDVIERLYQ